MHNQQVTWAEIIVQDPEFATGESIHNFIYKVLECSSEASWVVISGADWIKESLSQFSYHDSKGIVTRVDDLLRALVEIEQVDWAYFFFCRDEIEAGKVVLFDNTSQCVSEAKFSIIVADYSLFYLYVPASDSIDWIGRNYSGVDYQKGVLSSFNFP